MRTRTRALKLQRLAMPWIGCAVCITAFFASCDQTRRADDRSAERQARAADIRAPQGDAGVREPPPSAGTAHPMMTVDSVDLTVEAFFSALTSSAEEQRRDAMIFLLGVLDATEGRAWCDYRTLKTITLREQVFESLKKVAKQKAKERAATVIVDALAQSFPCRAAK